MYPFSIEKKRKLRFFHFYFPRFVKVHEAEEKRVLLSVLMLCYAVSCSYYPFLLSFPPFPEKTEKGALLEPDFSCFTFCHTDSNNMFGGGGSGGGCSGDGLRRSGRDCFID